MMNLQDSTSEINSLTNKRRHRTKTKRKSNIQIGDDGYDTHSHTDYHVILDTNDISVLNSDSETDTSFVFYEKLLKSTEYDLNDYEDDRVDGDVKLIQKSVVGNPDIDNIEHKVIPLTELNFIEETGKNHESLEEIHHSEFTHHEFESTRIIQPTTTDSTQLSSNSQYSICDDNLLQTSQTSVGSVSFITTRSQPKPLQSQKSSINPNTSSISYNSLAFKSKIKLPFNQPRIRIGLSKRTKLESLHPKFNKQ
ncbi:hypothetical protein B5S30_g535 [[Candida] boidinii]|nr:hypothetical protein B5S30_g535 [[Candida] boidinii]